MNVNITGVYDYTDLYDNIILLQNEVSSLENKTNFSSLYVSEASTLLSSLNVSGNSNLNNVNISGSTYFYGHIFAQQNIYGTSISPQFNPSVPNIALNVNTRGTGNLNLSSVGGKVMLNISGLNMLQVGNNATTCMAILNVIGNIIGSGTALTNLNYNAILNPPDLTIYATNTTISTLTTAIDDQFVLTTTYVDDEILILKEYTDQEIEALRTEGYIQEALTQLAAWATSDEGKRFRKKIWTRISSKWASLTGRQAYTELLDDVQQSTSDELDDMLKVYRYIDNFGNGIAGIRCDPVMGKDIVMKGTTYIYNGDLHLTGKINYGIYGVDGYWSQQKVLNDYFVMKGVKTLHCLDIDNTSELLELHYDDLDFELGPTPTYNLKLKYPIRSIHPTQCLSINPTTKQLEFNINTEYLEFQTGAQNTLKTKLELKGVKLGSGLSIDTTTKLLQYNLNSEYYNINASNQLSPVLEFKGIKPNNGLFIDSITKQLEFKYDSSNLTLDVNNKFKINIGYSLMSGANGIDVKLSDNSLDVSSFGLQVSTTYKTELQQLKTDTETFKTQAQTSKTGADTAKAGADAAKTQALTAAGEAAASATTAGTAATTATTASTAASASAVEATTAAGTAGVAAAAAAASSGTAGASAAAAGGSAAAAIAAAGAAAISATFFQKGDKGDKGDTGSQGIQGISGNPLSITWMSPLLFNSISNTASFDSTIINGHTTAISILNTSSSTLLGYVNTNNTAISYLNLTSTSLLNSINGHTVQINDLNATSTSIFNNINDLNSIISNTYTSERQYPPKVFDSSTTETTTTLLLGVTSYTETLIINSFSYGVGNYVLYSSSTYNFGEITKKLLFNYNLSDPSGAGWFAPNYISPGGTYNGSSYIVSDYTGDWIVIKLPVNIILTKFRFYQRATLASRSPSLWRCYGSNDGATFTVINEASNDTTAPTYTSGIYEKVLATSFNTLYKYIGFTVNKILGGSNADMINIQEIQIFGKELLALGYTTQILNLNTTSTTISNNLNSLSTNSKLLIDNKTNFSNLYVSGSSTLLSSLNVAGIITGNGTALSNLNYTSILNPPNLSVYATITNVNSTATTLLNMINNNNTSITTLNLSTALINTNLTSISTQTYLDIPNIKTTSTTIFNNLNSLSTNSILLINNNNTSISNLNATSTTLLNMINALTGTSTLSNLNSLSTNSILLINNKTNFSNLYVSGASTLLSSLNILGNIIGSGTNGIQHNGSNLSQSTIDRNLHGRNCYYNVSAGDSHLYSYWGVSINLNNGGANPSANTANARYPNTASFTINQKPVGGGAGSAFTNLFTVLQNGNVGIGTTTPSTALYVSGNTILNNATTCNSTLNVIGDIIASGSALTNLNYNSITNPPNLSLYLPLAGGTMTSSIIMTGSSSAFYFGGGGGAALGEAGGAGAFSSSAATNDLILRSRTGNNLILQSGGNGGAIIIDSSNNVSIKGILTLITDNWILSSDGILRIFFSNNSTTYFHSGSTGTSFIFRNFAQSDIFTITDAGNTSVSGTLAVSGIISSNGVNFSDTSYIQYPNYLYFKNTVANKTITFSSGHINAYDLNLVSNLNLLSLNSAITFYNKWFIFYGSANGVANSLIFNHVDTGINSYWWFNGTQTSTQAEISDERVKKQIENIENPLNKFMLLKPKQYYLCDNKDYTKKFGVIAQDVEIDFPELIYTDSEYIANITSYATYDNFIITFDKDITNLINIDDELKIVLDNNDKNNLEIVLDDTPYNNRNKKRYCKVIEIIDNYSFKIDIELKETNVFIFGKKVNDFKKLDYQSLYCLNIAATQELYNIIKQLENRILILESK